VTEEARQAPDRKAIQTSGDVDRGVKHGQQVDSVTPTPQIVVEAPLPSTPPPSGDVSEDGEAASTG